MLATLLLILESENERELFVLFYNHYINQITRISAAVLKDEELVKDAVQESFIKIIKNFDSFYEIGSLHTDNLVRIIARQCSIDLYRKRAKELVYTESLNEDNEPFEEYQFDSENELEQSLMQIKREYRDILILRYENGLSTREIAKLLNLTYENAKRRLSRAKDALKEAIDRSGENG